MALSFPMLPSFLSCIVQGSTSPFAVHIDMFVMPGLYNRCLCHVLNLTEPSVSIGAPDAMFPGCSLYKSFAVSVQSDLPCRLRWIVGKTRASPVDKRFTGMPSKTVWYFWIGVNISTILEPF